MRQPGGRNDAGYRTGDCASSTPILWQTTNRPPPSQRRRNCRWL